MMTLAWVNVVENGRFISAGRNVGQPVLQPFGIGRGLRYLPDDRFRNPSLIVRHFRPKRQPSSSCSRGSTSRIILQRPPPRPRDACPVGSTTMAYYTIYGFVSQSLQLPLRPPSTRAERGACTAGNMEDLTREPVRCAVSIPPREQEKLRD